MISKTLLITISWNSLKLDYNCTGVRYNVLECFTALERDALWLLGTALQCICDLEDLIHYMPKNHCKQCCWLVHQHCMQNLPLYTHTEQSKRVLFTNSLTKLSKPSTAHCSERVLLHCYCGKGYTRTTVTAYKCDSSK